MEKYCFVFYVTHQYVSTVGFDGSDIHEIKEIGVYSSHHLANLAIQRFSQLPGFSSYPNNFIISKVQCYYNESNKKDNLSVLYSPFYEEYLVDSDCDYFKRGVFFESASDACAVIQLWKSSKFSRHDGEYAVLKYMLNQDIRLWSEGFD